MSSRTDTTSSAPPPRKGNADDDVVVPTLMIVAGSHGVGKLIRIEPGAKIIIGRGADSHVWIDDESISRRHAEVVREGNLITIRDLESRNGTFVNDDRISDMILHDGDRILLGSTTIMKFTYRDSLDEALQLHLYEAATRDGLTGAHNKKYFSESADKEFKFAVRHGAPLSVLIIDIDHFKALNDQHGHLTGDRVLAQTASAIAASIRSGDVFARWGGEEFVKLLRHCTLEDAVKVAERTRRQLEALTFTDCPADLHITVSIGVASLVSGAHENATGLIESADEQLYQAKRNGRNRVCSPLEPQRELPKK